MDSWEIIIEASIMIGAISVITTIIVSQLKGYISKELIEMKKSITDMDYNHCKGELTEFLTDVKAGVRKSEVQLQRAYEVYARYTNPLTLKGNSYVTDEWIKLIK